jgi:hypothetical protein
MLIDHACMPHAMEVDCMPKMVLTMSSSNDSVQRSDMMMPTSDMIMPAFVYNIYCFWSSTVGTFIVHHETPPRQLQVVQPSFNVYLPHHLMLGLLASTQAHRSFIHNNKFYQ